MRANAGLETHRMAHQSADTSITIWKGVDVIEPVMRCWQDENARRHAEWCHAVAFFKRLHGRGDPIARRRDVAANCIVVFELRSPCARLHHESALGGADAQHLFGRVAVEFLVQPLDEFTRGRFAERAVPGAPIDLGF